MTTKGRPSPRWAVMQKFVILNNDGTSYLTRLRILQTPWFGVMLHWIHAPDPHDPHNHPWTFTSWVLRGGYQEQIYRTPAANLYNTGSFQRRRWSLHKMELAHAHRITSVLPGTVTLVFTGPRKQYNWGFYTTTGFFGWTEYPGG